MNKEDKELLLKDLCARLPYGTILVGPNGKTTYQTDGNTAAELLVEEGWKPYLRPLSSMTEEEKVQLSQYACIGEDLNGEFIDEVQRKDCAAYIDWLNRNHFDYRGLIEKCLAIVVNENNNPYK